MAGEGQPEWQWAGWEVGRRAEKTSVCTTGPADTAQGDIKAARRCGMH